MFKNHDFFCNFGRNMTYCFNFYSIRTFFQFSTFLYFGVHLSMMQTYLFFGVSTFHLFIFIQSFLIRNSPPQTHLILNYWYMYLIVMKSCICAYQFVCYFHQFGSLLSEDTVRNTQIALEMTYGNECLKISFIFLRLFFRKMRTHSNIHDNHVISFSSKM